MKYMRYNIREISVAISFLLLLPVAVAAQQTADEYRILGIRQFEKKEYGAAIKSFTECVRLDPQSVSCFTHRGDANSEQGNIEAALDDFKKAIEINPKAASPYFRRAMTYAVKVKNLDLAIADYNKGIELYASDPFAYYFRGLVYHNQSKYDEAIADFDRAIKIKPNCADCFYDRGRAYFKKNNREQAISDYRQAYKLDPEWELPKQTLRDLGIEP